MINFIQFSSLQGAVVHGKCCDFSTGCCATGKCYVVSETVDVTIGLGATEMFRFLNLILVSQLQKYSMF